VILLHTAFRAKLKFVIVFVISIIVVVFVLNNAVKIIYPLKYREYVYKYSVDNNIDPYLVFAVIKAESSFNPWAVSPKKARGLMQISEITGNWVAESLGIDGFSAEMLFEPEINIQIGCWYLSTLMTEFNNNLDLVIAAYNAGSGNVNKWLKSKDYSSSGSYLERIPFKETELYLRKVKTYYSVYRGLYEA
jgi:soluble lytic murein transglycosylase